MKTSSASEQTLRREWFVVDASDLIVGRMATKIATILKGKHKAIYTPNLDTGDFVVVVNAEKVAVTGKKETDKLYWSYSGFPGGEKSVTLGEQRSKHPERVILSAVKGMLPKGPLGRRMVKKLKVYAGPEHQHQAQQPKELKIG